MFIHIQSVESLSFRKYGKVIKDTAEVEDVRKAEILGVICWVTTNPSFIVKEGIKTNVTLIFSANQAPFSCKSRCNLCISIFRNYNLETQIIVASMRIPIHVIRCVLAGADIAIVRLSK